MLLEFYYLLNISSFLRMAADVYFHEVAEIRNKNEQY